MSDRIAAGVVLAVAAWYGFAASRLSVGFGASAVGPRVFPFFLAIVLAGSALGMMVRTDKDPSWFSVGEWVELLALVASFVLYAYLLVPIGFIVASALETAFVSWRFGSKYWQAVLVGVGASITLYVIFVFGLDIALPQGKVWVR